MISVSLAAALLSTGFFGAGEQAASRPSATSAHGNSLIVIVHSPAGSRPFSHYPAAPATISGERGHGRAAKAMPLMIVHQPHRLHPGMDDRRPDELEAAALQLLRDRFGERRGGDKAVPRAQDRLAPSEAPAEGGEILASRCHVA